MHYSHPLCFPCVSQILLISFRGDLLSVKLLRGQITEPCRELGIRWRFYTFFCGCKIFTWTRLTPSLYITTPKAFFLLLFSQESQVFSRLFSTRAEKPCFIYWGSFGPATPPLPHRPTDNAIRCCIECRPHWGPIDSSGAPRLGPWWLQLTTISSLFRLFR